MKDHVRRFIFGTLYLLILLIFISIPIISSVLAVMYSQNWEYILLVFCEAVFVPVGGAVAEKALIYFYND